MKKKAVSPVAILLAAKKGSQDPITVSAYMETASGATVVTNLRQPENLALAAGGKALKSISATPTEVPRAELASMVSVGECASCGSELLTSAEHDSNTVLSATDTCNCPSCGSAVALSTKELSALLDQADESEAVAASDEDEEPEEESDEDEAAESEDDEAAEDEDESEDDEDDEASDDEDEDEEETASAIAVNSPPAKTDTTTLVLDMSSAVDFRPETLTIVPLKAGLYAAFAETASGSPANIGLISSASATPANRKAFFDKPSAAGIRTMQTAIIAAMSSGDSLSDFGFAPVVHSISVDNAVAQAADARVEEASAKADARIAENTREMAAAMGTVATSMLKGFAPNPLVDSLKAELTSRTNIRNAGSVVTAAVSSSLVPFVKAIVSGAEDLMKKPAAVRAELATLMSTASSAPAREEEDGGTVDIATALLADYGNHQPAAREEASVKNDTRGGSAPTAIRNYLRHRKGL